MESYRLVLFLLNLVLMLNISGCYKLLVVFPFPTKSHGILGEGCVRTLLKAGHEVTYIAAVPLKNTYPGLRQINVSFNFDIFPAGKYVTITSLLNDEMTMSQFFEHFTSMKNMLNATVHNEEVQMMMMDANEQFDAVIVEWMYSEVYSGFSAVFGCPLIWFSSMEPHSSVLSLIDQNLNPAIIPDQHMSTAKMPMGLIDRSLELIMFVFFKLVWWPFHIQQSKIFNQGFSPAAAKRGRHLPSYEDAIYNGSLMLGNLHVSSGYAISLPQNYKPIGGYHIDSETKPLPKEWQNIMDEATHGVIYFSMGTMLKSKDMPDTIKTEILNVFKGLNQTVIWKFEEVLPGAPKNLHIMDWAPQQSILAHPNCVLFITHGGLLSTTEALHFGVPIIGIPMFGDQFSNTNRAVDKGFAKRVDISYTMADELKAAIDDMIRNPSFSDRAKELSFIYYDRPVTPGQELVHWTEHVIRTRGAPHLRSPALHVPFYQKMYLDLGAVLLIVLLLIRFSFTSLTRSNKMVDVNRKNK